MWWTAIPSAAVVAVGFAIAPIVGYVSNYLVLGRPDQRCVRKSYEQVWWSRDARINKTIDNPYILVGLENLEEECSPKKLEQVVEDDCTCPPKKTS